jgi:reactive intermediate/imine deaminase
VSYFEEDDMHVIITSDAPQPFGHYSQAVEHNGLIYVSGQLPALADGTHDATASFEVQAARVLSSLDAILKGAGSATKDLLKVTAYIVGAKNWAAFNQVYAQHLGDARPARSVVPVPELHHGYLIEIDAIARTAG